MSTSKSATSDLDSSLPYFHNFMEVASFPPCITAGAAVVKPATSAVMSRQPPVMQGGREGGNFL